MKEAATILIAEDSPTQSAQLQYILKAQGYNVQCAKNGKEALESILKNKPKLVISDVLMPEMSGYDLCRKLKVNENFKEIPIILLTILGNPQDVIKSLECGADAFISKPYDEDYLLARIKYFLENWERLHRDTKDEGVNLELDGRKYKINADRWQISNLLLSTYEMTVRKNEALLSAQQELKSLNEQLEKKVRERTAKLLAEINERKTTEMSLRKEMDFNKILIESSPAFFVTVGGDGSIIMMNGSMLNAFKYDSLDVSGMNYISGFVHADDQENVTLVFEELLRDTELQLSVENRALTRDGMELLVEWHLRTVPNEKGETDFVFGVGIDVTDRRKTEKALQQSEERYRGIFENAVEGIFQCNARGKYIGVNPSLARMLNFDSTHDMIAGVNDIGYRHYVDPGDWTLLKELLEEKGQVQAFETQLFRKDGSSIWVSINARSISAPMDKELCYEGIVEDITKRKQAEDQLERTLQELRRALSSTIRAMAATVETRDPYTAGHQNRVSELAQAIAEEMRLSAECVEGVWMAGVVHDIGKISVPAEILSKPGKLSDNEYSLIKYHPEVGYDILKKIESPLPIARIVLEHHERLNGSGYPKGLKGEEICIEARILAVADVVEAMASHRPYRPALGIDKALGEIIKNKGLLYEPCVVDACVRIFKAKRFTFDK